MSAMRRWSVRVAIAGAIIALGWFVVTPRIVEWRVRRAFSLAGFQSARFELTGVDVGCVHLHDVVLADGLALGDIDLPGSVALLATGHSPARATLRGPHVTIDQLARLFGGDDHGGKPLHVPELRVEHGVLDTAVGPVAVDGTISLPERGPITLDARAHLDTYRAGAITARDVVLTAHDAGGALRVCARATVADAAVDGCTSVPAVPDALRALHAVDVSGTAHAGGWSASARAHLAWDEGHPRVSGGHVHVMSTALAARGLSAGATVLDADVAGSLAPLGISIGGRAHTDHAIAHAGGAAATLHAISLPFVLRVTAPHGTLTVSAPAALVATASDATLALGDHSVTIDQPRVVLRDAGPIVVARDQLPISKLRWSAAGASLGGVHVAHPSGVIAVRGGEQSITWRALDGGDLPMPLGAGELRFAVDRGGPRVLGGHASLLGGELTVDPSRGPARGVVIRARNLELTPLLALIAHSRVTGRGRLDGALALSLEGAHPSIRSFTLTARGHGTLQVTDHDWQARAVVHIPSLAIHRRIVAALADFSYAHLSIALAPPGVEPELRVVLHGRGRLVDQEVDLSVAFHNVRTSLGAFR
jgi:hypothetical protein